MISLTDGLPNSLIIHGVEHKIKTDYRTWLRLMDTNNYKSLFIGKAPPPSKELIQEIQRFISRGEDSKGEEDSSPIIDFKLDADYIYSSFLQAYGINLLKSDMHWFEFMALFKSLPEETIMRKIIEYRQYDGKDEELLRLKRAWALPEKLTEEEKTAGDYFEEVFG